MGDDLDFRFGHRFYDFNSATNLSDQAKLHCLPSIDKDLLLSSNTENNGDNIMGLEYLLAKERDSLFVEYRKKVTCQYCKAILGHPYLTYWHYNNQCPVVKGFSPDEKRQVEADYFSKAREGKVYDPQKYRNPTRRKQKSLPKNNT